MPYYNFMTVVRPLYVQYGCGFTAPPEWINFDASFTLKWENLPLVGQLYTKNAQRFPSNVRIGDIVKGLPVRDGSCRGVYSSHMINHLSLDEFHKTIANTKRMLQEGGIFRCLVPDMEWIAREYLRRIEAGDHAANSFLMEATDLGRGSPRGLVGFIHQWLRTSEARWMWDSLSLTNALQEHGFQRVRQCSFGDCEDPMFTLVESRARFEHAVALEARL